ncbi:MAG: hypothetical protein CM15mP65_15550 [Crocinitomicaceae bacterium]|nr:MAG: hypothetical protein CM15mP65_15550 [Crocinitomicaceae bacterium]
MQRGLGYQYNGVGIDGGCQQAIGQNPPAIGIDFFEGPYQDNDGRDNILDTDVGAAYQDGGIPYKGLGIGYGDGIADNERYGMKRFTYFDYTLNNVAMSDPQTALNIMDLWKDIGETIHHFIMVVLGINNHPRSTHKNKLLFPW